MIIYFPYMSVEVQITFFFFSLKKKKISVEPRGWHTQASVKGGARANKGLPSQMVETQGDFHHRFWHWKVFEDLGIFYLTGGLCACCSLC